jgi:hypothetical protein
MEGSNIVPNCGCFILYHEIFFVSTYTINRRCLQYMSEGTSHDKPNNIGCCHTTYTSCIQQNSKVVCRNRYRNIGATRFFNNPISVWDYLVSMRVRMFGPLSAPTQSTCS